MPLYEYRCEACGHQFEVIQKFSDEPIAVCPKCGSGPVAKLLSSPAFQFKGTGWYITDYAQKGKAGSSDSAGTTKDDSKSSETKGGDTKSSDASSSSPAPASSTPAKSASGDS
jgi:putative FmdB family regulatory protein